MVLNWPNAYVFIWCLYYLQGILYPEGGMLSRTFLLLFFLISLFFFVKTIFTFRLPSYLKVTCFLYLFFVAYGIIRLFVGTDESWLATSSSTEYLKNISLSILPVFSFYYFTKKGYVDKGWFRSISIVYIIMALVMFLHYRQIALQFNDSEEITNNMGYLWLSLFPLLPLTRNESIKQHSLFLAILFFVISGFKRGAIFVAILLSIMHFFFLIRESSSRRARIKLIIFIIITVLAGLYFYNTLLSTSDFFNQRVEQTIEGDASNREWMYPMFFNAIRHQTNPFIFLFGNGADGTIKLFGTYAHQDWLEIGINQGIIGIIIYAVYWIVLLMTCLKARERLEEDTLHSLMMVSVAYFLISLFSMSINGMYLFSTSVLGYSIACYNLATSK